MYRIAIVEDNPTERSSMQQLLARYTREHDIDFHISVFTGTQAFVDAHGSFDLIFMDIDMPGINGMEAAALLRTYDAETSLVFVTNLAQYAIRGYEVDAIDFIVKPVSYQALCQHLQKILRVLRRNESHAIHLETRTGMHVIATNDILYVEVNGHNLIYHIMGRHGDSETLELRRTMKTAEAEVAHLATFVRVSNSHLVNMAYIRSITGDTLRLFNGEEIWFSRPRKKAALAAIARYLGKSM